ncbi:MAG: hypothetical protein ABDH49_07965 [Candidatus Hydrothermales bacterium]
MFLYKVPEKDKEIVLEPSRKEDIISLCEENRKKREKFREFFLLENEDNFKVASGHQTVFYHPGIWVKSLFLSELVKLGFKTEFFENDIDGVDRIFFYYPDVNNKIKREFLFYSPQKITLETLKSEEIKKNINLVFEVEKKIKAGEVRERAKKFFEIFIKNLDLHPSFSQAFSISRMEYEESVLYKTSFLSASLSSEPFLHFFSYFFINAQRVYECYNEAIAEYREKFGITNKTEPALPLEKDGDLIELPFFLNLRERLRVFKRGDKLICEKFEISLGNQIEEVIPKLKNIPLRPKGLILSMYNKIFGADLFYHGVSGKNYDEATNIFIKKLFKLDPPKSGVISLTIYLGDIKKRDFPFFLFDKEEIVNIISSTLTL